jgi:hypothetical protein
LHEALRQQAREERRAAGLDDLNPDRKKSAGMKE